MTDSPVDSSLSESPATTTTISEIPIETVSDEEMAFIEAALAAATRCSSSSSLSSSAVPALRSPSSSHFRTSARSIQSISVLSKRGLSDFSEPDIEDSGNLRRIPMKGRVSESLLYRFRRKRGLAVTDITATEWCEKQIEFTLLFGRPKTNKAMAAGSARHLVLEEEVVKKVKVHVVSPEDVWALKFLNFVIGVNQLLFEGLTRELSIIGFAEGVWMVGVIDEVRTPVDKINRNPILVDTKTRVRDTLPSESQKRNGRLQLMCYKFLWDNLAAGNFPVKKFFDFYSLNPYSILSEEIRESTARSGFPAKTLDDVIRYYTNTSSMLPPSNNQLLLRYELQKDNSLLGEDEFAYDSDLVNSQIKGCLEFWLGERKANYVPEEESWKCRYCQFASVCPSNFNPGNSTPSDTNTNRDITPPPTPSKFNPTTPS